MPILLGVYLAGVLLLLAKVAAEQLVVRRFARRAAPVARAEWNVLLCSVAAALRVRRPVVLLRSEAPTMPFTWGVVRPFILIPTGADEWPAARRQAVLLHEMAHVARHDCLTQTLAAIACALYWPHPGVWWAARRLRVEQELACDDQVLTRGIPARDYAGHLLAVARARRVAPLAALGSYMAAPSHLEVRMRAAIDRTRARAAPGKRAAVLSALLTAALLLPLSVIRADGAKEEPYDAAGAPRAGESAAPLRTSPEGAGLHGGGDTADGEMAEYGADAAAAAQASSQASLGGIWNIRLTGADEVSEMREAHGDVPLMHVLLREPGFNTFYLPLTSLEGLSAEQVASTGAVRFRLRKDAGTFTFVGDFRGGSGTGRFEFTPDPAFADALARRGLARPTPEQQLSLARHDVGLDLLDELAAHGYAQPTTEVLDRVGRSGVDVEYIREMAELGYRLGTVEELIRLSNRGVNSLIRELASLGYRGLAPADLLRMRNSGVNLDFVQRMNERAGRRLTPAELVELRNRGGEGAPAEGPAPADARAPAEGPTASSSTPLEGRWVIHRAQGASADLELFWTDTTNWRRWIPTAELHGVSAGTIAAQGVVPVSFRIEQDAGIFEFNGTFRNGGGSGEFRFRPNRQFASTLRSLGVEGVGSVTDHHLKNFAWGDISAAEIREFRALGLWPLTFDDARRLAIYGATPDYVRGMHSAGVSDATTVSALVRMRISGVTTGYARDLAALGYGGLSERELVQLWRGRVTPEFVRSVHEAGYTGVSPETLIAMRRRGIEATRAINPSTAAR
jgi:hypothetical protein